MRIVAPELEMSDLELGSSETEGFRSWIGAVVFGDGMVTVANIVDLRGFEALLVVVRYLQKR